MTMQNILHRIFSPGKVAPPKPVIRSFQDKYGDSINIEWHREKENFEALFYIDDAENIALFAPDGKILEHKKNLLLTAASPAVTAQAALIGEMMNLIEIDRQGVIYYEVIARDGYLDRYYLLLNSEGKLIDKKKL